MSAAPRYLALFLMLVVAVALPAFDFGAVATSQTETAGSAGGTLELDQSVVTQGWIDAPLGAAANLSAQGSFRYSLGRAPYGNLDELVLDTSVPVGAAAVVRLTSGRFLFEDPTGLVLSDPADGVRVSTILPLVEASASAGYTGLTFDRVSTVAVSRSDVLDRSDDSILAPPRLLLGGRLSFLELIGRQNLTLGVSGQLDFRPEDEVAGPGDLTEQAGGRVDTGYLTAVVSGPVGAGLFYDVFAVMNFGNTLYYDGTRYRETDIRAGLLGGSIELFAPTPVRPTVTVTGLFATGDADATTSAYEGNTDGLSRGFEPISAPSLGLLVAPRIQNLIAGGLDASITPFAEAPSRLLRLVSVTASGLVLARPTTGIASLNGVDPFSEAIYLGTEGSLRIDARLLSDFGIALAGGAFFPNPEAFSDGSLRFEMSLTAAFSL